MRPSALVLSTGHPTAPSRTWVSQKVLEQPLINTDPPFLDGIKQNGGFGEVSHILPYLVG